MIYILYNSYLYNITNINMGIPLYFSFITKQYPNIIKNYNQILTKCNKLFIDFNAIIHQSSNNLKNQLKIEQKIISSDNFETLLLNNVCNSIDNIYNSFDHSELNLIYIAFDGITPFAKTIQQKKRRFNSAHIQEKKINDLHKINVEPFIINFTKNEWNSSNISVQTSFMNEMSKKIKLHMKNNYTNKIKKLKIIISDTTEFGEGEHKIFNYLKNYKQHKYSSHELNETIFIHGLDADLILLSMINLNNYNIYLMREQQSIINYLSINEFKIYLLNHLKNICNMNNDINDINNDNLLIMNYAFICVFLGNDFLPHLSYISLDNNGLELLNKTFCNLLINDKIFILNYDVANNKYYIDFCVLNKYFEILSENEDNLFKEFVEKYDNIKPHYGTKLVVDKNMTLEDLEKYYKNYAIIHKQNLNLFSNLNSWRINYYNLLFTLDTQNNIQEQASINYIEGLNWYVDYYFNHELVKGWFFKYNYSPLILDLYLYTSFITSINNDKSKIINILYNNKSKYDDYELGKNKDDYILQLFYILPYNSCDIINKLTKNKYNYIYDKMSLGFYYPQSYELITYLKKYYYEGIPNTPFLNINLLKNEINKVK